jgi:lipoprotein-anchoring transpeptidase ErfK/SrfK
VLISVPEQVMHVYRNGILIGRSTVSTGSTGHATPGGVFSILEKKQEHYSKTYDNAPMPNMQRLTWTGIAMHSGNLPGYPASHGCIRLPFDFSRRRISGRRCCARWRRMITIGILSAARAGRSRWS